MVMVNGSILVMIETLIGNDVCMGYVNQYSNGTRPCVAAAAADNQKIMWLTWTK